MRRIAKSLIVAVALALLVSGCGTHNPGGIETTSNPTAEPSPSAGPLAVEIAMKSGATATSTSDPVSIKVTNGQVTLVVVESADGKRIPGNFANDQWVPERTYFPNTKYQVTVTARDETGKTETFKHEFRTMNPKIDATFKLHFMNAEFGVGMPVMIWFDSPVATAEQRAAVQRAAKVTSVPAQVGAWGWINDRQLIWRPKDYWQPGTKVTLDAQIAGLQTGPDKWLEQDATGSFTVGAKHRSVIDMAKFQMTVFDDDKQVKEIPVTNGIDQYPTRYGVKVILDKVRVERMKSEGTDVKNENYDLQVNWALRTTWTGEYLHAAPWSQWSHGKRNASHGCTGMSNANAEWYFNFSRIGDIVEYVGSNRREFQQHEGLAVWNLSWDDWQKLSAAK